MAWASVLHFASQMIALARVNAWMEAQLAKMRAAWRFWMEAKLAKMEAKLAKMGAA